MHHFHDFFIILHGIVGATDVFQLLTRVLDGFFEFRILRVDEIDPSQFFVRFQDGAFHSTTFASPSTWRAFPIDFQSSGHRWSGLAWM